MRRGFTLVELMVSIGIFAVVAAAMLTMLFGATELFRRGEAARQSGDEATLVMAALREDLSRAVPVRLRGGSPAAEWGWMRGTVAGGDGNCVLAFAARNPEAAEMSATGTVSGSDARTAARQYICWFVAPDPSDPTDATKAQLRRAVYPDGNRPGTPAPTDGVVMSYGCLHFGVWFELAQAHRPVTAGGPGGANIDWETDQPPLPGFELNTDLQLTAGSTTFWPQPDAIRISLVLTGGGRYATRGTLARDITDSDTQARIVGIRSLPTVAGSLLRLGDEWVRYEDFRDGVVSMTAPTDRGALRSTKSAHGARSVALAGQVFSLVVELPH